MTKHINIDDLLHELDLAKYKLSNDMPKVNLVLIRITDTKQQLYDLISNEIIGEDETESDGWDLLHENDIADCCPADQIADSRNLMKATQRTKLTQLFNPTESEKK